MNTSASNSNNLEEYHQAIAAHDNALTVIQPGDNSARWANVRFRLGFALREAGVIADDPALLQRSYEVIRATIEDTAIADLSLLRSELHLQLGYTLGRLYAADNEQTHLQEALLAFETASNHLDPTSNRKIWMDAQYGIADSAYRLSLLASDTAYLRRSVAASLQALEYFDRTDRHNFGVFSYETAANLDTIAWRDGDTDARRKAIALFNDAAEYVDATEAPAYYADIVGSRANALAALDRTEPGQELFDKARRDYETAIELFSRDNREAEARGWRNLGLLYRNHDRLMHTHDWQDEALAAFKAAIKAYGEPTNDTARADLFRAHYNVGETLADQKFVGADAAHLRQIVAAFTRAVAISPEIAGDINWADGQHHLGLTLYELGLVENEIATFKKASDAFDAALTVRTLEADIAGWMDTQSAIADIHFQLGYRTDGTGHYEGALAIYEAAIDNYPAQWTNLGAAHYQMKKANAQYLIGDRAKDIESLRNAIDTYRIALEMARNENALDFRIGVGQNLGKTLKQVAAATNDFDIYRESADAYRTVLALIPDTGAEQLLALTQRDLGLVLVTVADAGGDIDVVDEAIGNLNAATGYFTLESNPAAWAYIINNRAWLNIVAGRRDGDLNRFDRAAASLRQVVAVQRDVQDLPNLAFSEDSLCAALVELGTAKKQKPLLLEAVDACGRAVNLLRSQNQNAIANTTEKLLAQARNSLGALATAQP